MNNALMYVEYFPALLAFVITLVWFCAAVAVPDEAPPMVVWGAMVCVTLGGASIFLLPPVAVWFVVAGQVVFSVGALTWMKRTRQSDLQLQHAKSNESFGVVNRDHFQDGAFGK